MKILVINTDILKGADPITDMYLLMNNCHDDYTIQTIVTFLFQFSELNMNQNHQTQTTGS